MRIIVERGNVTPPRSKRGARARYPFAKCININDNFFIPNMSLSVACCITAYWNKKYKGIRHFLTRTDVHLGVNGVRIWRNE